jgi:hypothetical protein
MFKLQGKVHHIGETDQVTENFCKRELVILDDSNADYPQYIMFEAIQDKVDILDAFKANDEVEVSFNLRGREWTNDEGVTRYFNTLQAWRVELCKTGAEKMQAEQPSETPAATGESGDLPF